MRYYLYRAILQGYPTFANRVWFVHEPISLLVELECCKYCKSIEFVVDEIVTSDYHMFGFYDWNVAIASLVSPSFARFWSFMGEPKTIYWKWERYDITN